MAGSGRSESDLENTIAIQDSQAELQVKKRSEPQFVNCGSLRFFTSQKSAPIREGVRILLES
jgi:hypothetical protein